MRVRVSAVDRHELAIWCEQHLGSRPLQELFRSGYLSAVVGVRLEDGREVVVKVREPSSRLDACVIVHQRLAAAGFLCPEPLTRVLPFGERVATAEVFVAGDAMLPSSGRAPEPFARAFALLLSCAPAPTDVGSLLPAPSWVAWNRDDAALWPVLEDYDVDLNAVGGPVWLDDAGRAARDRLRSGGDAIVLGHCDFYAGNLRWEGQELLVLHDWDSVVADSEAALVGFAAAVYPTLDAGDEATVDESAGFLADYQRARRAPFNRDEIERSWAAGVWLRAFDAKKQLAVGHPVRSLSEREARQRLAKAGTAIP